jgi:DNA repair exonuclease SbcCD ATPase subunit
MDAQPLGNECDEAEIRRQVDDATRWEQRLVQDIQALEGEHQSLASENQTLQGKISTLCERERLLNEAALEADRKANASESQVQDLKEALAPEWGAVAEDRECYEVEQRAVDDRRALAEQAGDLHEAPGILTSIRNQLEEITAEADTIPLDHRIGIGEAEDLEQNARSAEREIDLERVQVDKARQGLLERQCEATNLMSRIQDLERQSSVFGELAEILKDGGPLQTEIALREQQQIVDEVNEVLRLLNDPLQVKLGEPRRRNSAVQEMQDLVVVDTSDPLNAPSYFEFLSGGEQFRVALALALALHRRVAGDTPGTLMVDEGFGALDTNRRDALALQMVSDSHHGILGLGLAESIVLCSHSSEVQRYFPNRWHVTKHDGTASVSCVTAEDVLESVM